MKSAENRPGRCRVRQPSPFDPEAINHVNRLAQLDVQKLRPLEELSREHAARLARLATSKVRETRWDHLKRCDGGPCPNAPCSAACAFGERYEVNKLVLEAAERLSTTGLPLFFVHLIDPGYFVKPTHLSTLSIDGLFQSLRRRFREAPPMWDSARAVGGLHVSFDRDDSGREFWSPHVHLVVGVAAEKDEVREVLRPRRPPPLEYVGKKFRPIEVTPVTDLANAISYASKVVVDTRDETFDARGNRDRQAFDLPFRRVVEHDRWLLRLRPRQRIFLRGMMNTRGGLALRN